MTNKLTDEELTEKLTKHCCRCPFCDSEDVESELMSADGPTAFTEVECLQCGAEWRENYKFVSAEVISGPTRKAGHGQTASN